MVCWVLKMKTQMSGFLTFVATVLYKRGGTSIVTTFSSLPPLLGVQ